MHSTRTNVRQDDFAASTYQTCGNFQFQVQIVVFISPLKKKFHLVQMKINVELASKLRRGYDWLTKHILYAIETPRNIFQ